MLEVMSQNFILFSASILIIVAVSMIFIFSKEIKMIFFDKNLLVLLLSFSLYGLVSITFTFPRIVESLLNMAILLILSSLILAMFNGLFTKIILQIVRKEQSDFVYALFSFKKWFIPSLIAFWLGFGGNLLIFTAFPSLGVHYRVFLVLVWTVLTFAMYPLLIAREGNLFLIVPRAFKITLLTIHKWFYLFLIIIFVSGEFLQLFPSSSARVSWISGYSFQPIWYDIMIKSADLSPTTIICIYIGVSFISSVIATLVKIKLTKILFDSGYISNNS